MRKKKNEMNPETIAYWFFRLNGCATITNFVVHPDRRGSQRTDVDVLAVRFPQQAGELPEADIIAVPGGERLGDRPTDAP